MTAVRFTKAERAALGRIEDWLGNAHALLSGSKDRTLLQGLIRKMDVAAAPKTPLGWGFADLVKVATEELGRPPSFVQGQVPAIMAAAKYRGFTLDEFRTACRNARRFWKPPWALRSLVNSADRLINWEGPDTEGAQRPEAAPAELE